MDVQSSLPMIGVTLVEDFVKNPPPYFQVQHCMRHPVIRPVPEMVTLCAHDKSHEAWFPDSMGRVLKVETVQQYDQLVQKMLNRPLVFDVKLERRHKSGRIRYILKCDIIVTVNTSHPVVRAQMQKLFEGGREDIVAGRNFALDFNFNYVLKAWFSSVHQGQDGLFDTNYDCTYARVVVTNSSEFNSMYECSPEGVCLFLMCLPFCIFMCPAYRIARCLSTVDRAEEIAGEVSYLTFKTEQRSAQDELLDMFRQYLVQQVMRQSSGSSSPAAREYPYPSLPEVTTQPGGRPPSGMAHPPPHMYQPYPPPMNESGRVEHPISPYGYGIASPPPGAGYPSPAVPPYQPAPHQHLPPGQGALARPPAGMGPHPSMGAPPYSQPVQTAPAPHPQADLPSYDYAMSQTSSMDQLIT